MNQTDEESQRMDKERQPFEQSKDQEQRYRRLKAQLLAADALFEAARAGERGEPSGRVLEAWMDWFMSEAKVKGEGA